MAVNFSREAASGRHGWEKRYAHTQTFSLRRRRGLGSRRFPLGAAARRDGRDAPLSSVTHTDDEWRKLLTPAQYNVLRG